MRFVFEKYIAELKTNAWDLLLTAYFILHLQISTVSNYKSISIVVKVVSTVMLAILCFVDMRKHNYSFATTKLLTKENRLFLFTMATLIVIPLLSLAYSYNYSYGISKYFLIIANTIPTIITFYYLLSTLNENRVRAFLFSLSVLVLVSSFIVISLKPFTYDSNYAVNFSRWSHVIFGRFIGISSLIFLCCYLFTKKKNNHYLIIAVISLVSLVISEFRAGLISIIALISFLMIYHAVTKTFSKKKIIALSFLLAFVTGVGIVVPIFSDDSRMESLVKNFTDDNHVDGAVNARELGYLYSIESIVSRPLLGVGFGGFYSKEVAKEVYEIKYPHNIFLEIGCELGVPILLIFSVILFSAFRFQYQFHPSIFFIFLFTLLLAQFSKDLPSQVQLLIGLAFLGKLHLRDPIEQAE